MDRREPPRIGPADGPGLDLGAADPARPASPSRRFARLVESPAARRLATGRLGRAVLALAAVVGLVVVGGSSVSRSVVAWLHRRPEYRAMFADIALEPPPPPWIKGGREALLEAVRDDRSHLETLSILDLDLSHILTDFRRNPWVARADRAEKGYPNRLTVALAYREPVALVRAGPGPPTPVDREGVVLPASEFDPDRAGPLATIEAEPASSSPEPGLAWPGPGERVLRAARLAGRLKDLLRAAAPGDWAPEAIEIRVDGPARSGFWVKVEGTFVLWSRYARLDAPDGPSDDDIWRALAAKARADGGLKPLGPGEYLDARDRFRVRKTP